MKEKRAAAIFISILSLLLVLLAGCSESQNKKQTNESTRNPVKVKVQKPEQGTLTKTLDYKGTVFPWKRANIGPDISGRIHKIYKKQGDTVKKGELLAELDSTTLKLRLKQANAALDAAKAAHKDALLNVRRLENLYAKSAISKMQLEKAKLNLDTLETQEKNAKATLDVVQHNLGTCYMRAPFTGIITSRNMEEGDVINPMMGMGVSVLTLMDLSKVKVILAVPSEDIEQIVTGQVCNIKVSTLKDQTFTGEVYSKNLAADPVSKTFKVEIKIKNPEIRIKTGVYAEVSIVILRRENCLLLPLSALMKDGEKSFVVLYDNGKAKFKTIKAGEKNDHQFEVLEGLTGNELVVTEGNYDLKNNAPITDASGGQNPF